MRVALLITAFLRDNLFFKTLQTIVDFFPDNCILLIADQGYNSQEKNEFIQSIKEKIPCEYYRTPWDSGISYNRNFLVEKANELECSYILMMADSLQLTSKPNLQPIIEMLESNPNYGIVGFSLENYPVWRGTLDLIPGQHFLVDVPKEKPIIYNGISFLPVDHVSNFFLGKTKVLLENKWDENLRLMEFEDFFWRLKTNTPYKVFYTDFIKGKHIKNRNGEYEQYRGRATKEYNKLVEEKYKIKRWVKVSEQFYPYLRKNNEK
jgi:hypothetical protein